MTTSSPPASVIVRTKNSSRTLGRVFSLLRSQTVPVEIIVVDSGSNDATIPMARRWADHVIDIDAASFTFGYALNVGAAIARAPIHFALSSHAFPPDDRWIERSLSKYDRSDVAGTSGAPTPPDSQEPLLTTFYQTYTVAQGYPWWGFSNTGSSWRADVWKAFPFNEHLSACEDKEWGLRVLASGWVIAIESNLSVSDAHRRHHGIRHLYRRAKREYEAIGSFTAVPSYTISDFAQEWLTDLPADAPYHGWRRRLNYFRLTELIGKYKGLKTPVSSLTQRAATCVTPSIQTIDTGDGT